MECCKWDFIVHCLNTLITNYFLEFVRNLSDLSNWLSGMFYNSNTIRKEASTLTTLRWYCLYNNVINNNDNISINNNANNNNLEDPRMLKPLYKPLTSSPLVIIFCCVGHVTVALFTLPVLCFQFRMTDIVIAELLKTS